MSLFAESDWLLPIVIILIVGALFFVFLLLRSSQVYPYEKITCLFTKTELTFYRQLRDYLEPRYLVFGKVRIADLLKVKKGSPKRLSWQNRINCKHIDFVLCDPKTQEILVAIELDDRSHEREDRIKRDEFVNKAFDDAQFPILRVKTQKEYDLKLIDSIITKSLSAKNRTWVFHVD